MIMKAIMLLATLLILYSCHDTRPFETVRNVKHDMTIDEVEGYMGKPVGYQYINDSTESRRYVFDHPHGHDQYLRVGYTNGYVIYINQE